MFKSLVTAFSTLVFLTSFSSQADAQQSVLSGVISNNTHLTVPYQIRVGNGQWTTYRLPRGARLAYSFPSNMKNVPVVYVRFDNDMTSRTNLQTTTLLMLGCSRPGDGWLQSFTIVNFGRNLALMR